MNSKDFSREVIMPLFTKHITDRVFLMIENDGDLLKEYLRLVSNEGLDHVSQTIGKEVKDFYKLKNLDENKTPKSKLIKSYTEHEKQKNKKPKQ